jgi:hypothetical protein
MTLVIRLEVPYLKNIMKLNFQSIKYWRIKLTKRISIIQNN